MVDRLLTINIRKYLSTQPRVKRARKAVNYIKDRIAHYTKTDIENVKMSQELNSLITKHYARRMVPIKLNIKIENEIATASPFSEKKKEEPKPAQRPAAKGIITKVAPKPEKPASTAQKAQPVQPASNNKA